MFTAVNGVLLALRTCHRVAELCCLLVGMNGVCLFPSLTQSNAPLPPSLSKEPHTWSLPGPFMFLLSDDLCLLLLRACGCCK